GVSNGARAASHLGVDETFSWKSMILVTPVIDGEALHELVRLPKSMRPRLLVVYGGMDDRVPPSYVEQHVNRLRARDMSVDVEEFAEANHFLFFSYRTELQERLGTVNE